MEQRRELRCEYRLKVAKVPAEELWASWQQCFPLLTNFVNDLYNRLEIFTDMVEVVKANPTTLEPPILWNWICENYVVAECMAIRRMLDVDERSVSLGRLLREIEIRPELISKARYRAVVAGKGPSPPEADEAFERMLGPLDQITPEIVAAQIETLEAAESSIRRLVNKRFAHASPFTEVVKFPVFKETDAAIEELDQVVVMYDSLIYGGFMSTAHSVKLNWKRPLEIAWLPRENRHAVPEYGSPKHRAR